MRPLHLTIEGLRSYRDAAEIDFSALGLSALIGDTGAGKSSIIEAITVALYNRPTWPAAGRNVQALRADGAAAMRVVLQFAVGPEHTWTVTRIHRAGAQASVHKLECVETGEKVDGERAINGRIVALIGLDYEQFIKAVVIPQGQFAKLLDETEATRTRTLKGIFRLDHLSDVKAQADGLIRRFAPPTSERRGRRSALPADAAAALAEATDGLARSEATAAALRAGLAEVERLAEAARELGAAAAAVRTRAVVLAGRIDPGLPAILSAAGAAAGEIAADEAAAAASRGAAQAAQASARRDAAAALLPFASRDEAVRARVTLESAAVLASELASRAGRLRARRVEVEDPGAAARRAIAAGEAATALAGASAATEAHTTAAERCAIVDGEAAEAARQVKVEVGALAGADRNVASARKTLDAAVHGNALVVVAGDRAVGDACPVCRRALPVGYEPPSDPGIDRARTRLVAAEDAQVAARTAVSAAEAQREETAAQVVAARRALDAAGHAREVASGRHAAADRAWRDAEDDHRRSLADLERDEAQLAEDRDKAGASIAALPAGVPDLAGIDAALASSAGLLTVAAEQDEVAGLALARMEAARARLDAEVHRPVAAARTATLALASELPSGPGRIHAPPGPDAAPGDLAVWAAGILDAAAEAVAAASVEAADLESRAAAAASAVVHRCAAHGAKDAVELKALAATADGTVAVERHQVAALGDAVRDAAALDEYLDVGEPFLANLEVLSQTLTDGRFIHALVAERERELLVEASRKLRELTGDNFGFADAFRIVDRRTGQQRPPETLSGGERFLASLALALGLVEIATRGGGQLDALFLDEGFGSLDSSSLDQALATLGGLAVGGKLVVLVSHLRRVAEHVDDVLLVTRDDVTGSRVRTLDPDERDRLLAEDARTGLTL